MKNYERPIVMINEDLAEGVYAYSGANCYTSSAEILQTPELGRETYVIKLKADHTATDHHSTGQVVTVTFNVPVDFVSMTSGGEGTATYRSGTGTNTIIIDTTYHNNNPETGIGLGELTVKPTTSTDVVTTPQVTLSCNYTCAKHDHLGNY